MLDVGVLKEEYLKFADPANEAFPKTMKEAAEFWGEMLATYCKEVTPKSLNQSKGRDAFVAIMESATAEAQNWPALLPGALTAFAAQVGAGMGVVGYTGTPNPQSYAGLPQVIALGMTGADTEQVATLLSSTLHTWFLGCRASNSNGSRNWA